MLLLNIDYVPGKEIEPLGLVKGTVVQSKSVADTAPRMAFFRRTAWESVFAGFIFFPSINLPETLGHGVDNAYNHRPAHQGIQQ